MKLVDKLKDIAKITDEGYFDEIDENRDDYANGYDDDYQEPQEQIDSDRDIYSDRSRYNGGAAFKSASSTHQSSSRQSNVVDIRSSSPNVIIKKLESFDEVCNVADELNNKKIVILNLETCPNDVSRRVLDFLYGVAYANNGEIKNVASRAYIITPFNVAVTGELLNEIENSGAGKIF